MKSKILKSSLIAVLVFAICGFLAIGFSEKKVMVQAQESQAGKTEIYMLAPENGVLMQSFVIKTANGKIIVLDGGTARNGVNNTKIYLSSAIRAILGLGENGYFEVDTWIISHAHGDHFYELAKMLEQYNDQSNFKINNLYFDFPAAAKGYEGEGISTFLSGIENYAKVNGISTEEKSYYDQLNGAFVNAEAIANGLEVTIDGVRIEFLQTYDLGDGANANEHSLVYRVHANGQSILFLNDLASVAGKRLLRTYGAQLKSDMVQMAHHGQDGVTEDVYQAIDADVRFWDTPIWVWNNPSTYQIGEVRKWINNGVDFFENGPHDFVACLYEEYPTDYTKVSDWVEVKDYMKVELPYAFPPRGPVSTLESGCYEGEQTIELKTAKNDCEIYYTLDGSYPQVSKNGEVAGTTKLYKEPITLNAVEKTQYVVLRAIALSDGQYSKVTEKNFILTNANQSRTNLLAEYGEENWNSVNATWTVEDGVATVPQSSTWGNAFVFTQKKYKNFILEGEFSISELTAGHVGFQIYRTETSGNLNGSNGYCVLIENGGRIVVYDGVNGGTDEYGDTSSAIDYFTPENFTFRVVSINDMLFVSLNGKSYFAKKDERLNRDEGYIALNTGIMGVSVTNLWIEELGEDSGLFDVEYGEFVSSQVEEMKIGVNLFDFKDDVIKKLPQEVSFYTTGKDSVKIPVTGWASEDYDRKVVGWYTFTATLDVSGMSGVINLYNLKATVKVYVSAGVDTGKLQALVDFSEELDPYDFSEESWTEFEIVLIEAIEICENPLTEQSEIDGLTQKLQSALDALENLYQDKSALNQLIAQCNYDKSNYTAVSFANYEQYLEEAKEVSKDNFATQTQINQATANLQTAVAGLVAYYDKSILSSKVDEAKGIDKTLYTESSVNALNQAIEQAESVLNMQKVSISVGNLAYDQLDDAINGLKLKNGDKTQSGENVKTDSPKKGGCKGNIATPTVLTLLMFTLFKKIKQSKI